uniref:SET domain-containing protein n=1 Tax=Panagrellus redivivus TaxID=6233 RepID=A0A7E4V6Z8_PANRE
MVENRRRKRAANTDPADEEFYAASVKFQITDFFPVRRSARKTGKTLQEEKEKDVLHRIENPEIYEKDLIIKDFGPKGRGIVAPVDYKRNDFVVEYKGELISIPEAERREQRYSQDERIGSYMYYFKRKGHHYCVDATAETPYKGRLVNHSFLNPNLHTKVVEAPNNKFYLCLFAKRAIKAGDELLYDYGDHSPKAVANNPWIIVT